MTTASLPIRPAIALSVTLAADLHILPDGTLWSQACTLGRWKYADAWVEITREKIESWIRVFATGHPRKVCVDYDHGSVNGVADGSVPVPKAGDVMEMRGVFATEDFDGDLKATAEKLCAKTGRSLSHDNNRGLWIRFKPTARALGMIQAREYTELSVAFDEFYINPETGEDQGPTLHSVALTNTPFLQDMLSVAASRPRGGSPTGEGAHVRGDEIMPENQTAGAPGIRSRLMSTLSALLSRPVGTEEEVETAVTAEVTQLRAQIQTAAPDRAFATRVRDTLGESDPEKAIARINTLRQIEASAAASKKTQLEAQAETVMLKHEQKLNVPLRAHFKTQLASDLEKGQELGKTDTEKLLSGLAADAPGTSRESGADEGQTEDAGDTLAARRQQILAEDKEVAAIAASGQPGAQSRALKLAERKARAERTGARG